VTLARLTAAALERERTIVRRVLLDAVGRDWLGLPLGEAARLAFAYLRVSGDRQAEEDRNGLLREVREIDGLARELGVHVSFNDVIADDYTGQEEHRPGMDRLLDILRARPVADRTLLVEQIDRLGRRIGVQFILRREVERAGGRLLMVKEQDKITELAMGLAAEVEIEKLAERSRQANFDRMGREETIATRPRYGYRFARVGHLRKYVIDDERAAVVRRISALFQELRSLPKLQAALYHEGIAAPKGGRVWSQATLRAILTDETYTGTHWQRRWRLERRGYYTASGKPAMKLSERPRDQWMRMCVPRILEPEDLEENRRILAGNVGGRPPRAPSLLAGILFCGGCGRRLYFQRGNGGPRYRCPRRSDSELARNGQSNCFAQPVKVADLDELVWNALASYLGDPRRLHAFLVREAESHHDSGARLELERRLASAEKALENARAALDRAAEKGPLEQELNEAVARARTRRDAAASALASSVPARVPTLAEVTAHLAAFHPDAVALEERRAIALAILDRIELALDASAITISGAVPVRALRVRKWRKPANGRTAPDDYETLQKGLPNEKVSYGRQADETSHNALTFCVLPALLIVFLGPPLLSLAG
jgi:site-specific DNA recombinase